MPNVLKTKAIPNPLPDRSIRLFWAYIVKGESGDCWKWKGPTNQDGYGLLYIGKRGWFAHRLAFVIANGPIPDGHEVIAHRCDNPLCVNPDHLFSATVCENVQDRQNKRRQAKGETLHTSKLTEQQVLEIRRRYIPYKVKLKTLAAEYGVSLDQIWRVARCKHWRHLGAA